MLTGTILVLLFFLIQLITWKVGYDKGFEEGEYRGCLEGAAWQKGVERKRQQLHCKHTQEGICYDCTKATEADHYSTKF